MKAGRLLCWCTGVVAVCALGGVGHGAILVLRGGLAGEGRVVSRNERDVVFVADGTTVEVRVSWANIASLVETDEHGGELSLTKRTNLTWDVPPEPAAPSVLPPGKGPTYYLIPLHGEVGGTILASALEKSLADAVLRKPTVVVLDIDSPGGLVDEAKKITKVLHHYNKLLRIVALTDQDLSAAAILTLSVREIYVKSSSTIGAATSFRPAEINLPPKLEEKMQSVWRAVARNSADEGGHEPLLAVAMIDNDLELHLERVDGKPVVHEGPGETMLCRKGKVLTLDSHEAVNCGLARGEADDLDELGKELKLDGWTESKGLGTLLAAYLPERNAKFKAYSARLSTRFRQVCVQAMQTSPSTEVSQRLVRIAPARSARVGAGATPPPTSQPVVVSTLSHEHWYNRSLLCVLALQQAEHVLSDERTLCEAFGQEGLGDLVGEMAIEIGAARAAIYDNRNRFGGGANNNRGGAGR